MVMIAGSIWWSTEGRFQNELCPKVTLDQGEGCSVYLTLYIHKFGTYLSLYLPLSYDAPIDDLTDLFPVSRYDGG